jgi:allene oxide cyclase
MHLRRGLSALAATTFAISAVAVTPAGATRARASAPLTVVEHAITDTEIPTGGGTDVKGNILTFINPVFNAADTKKVGHDEGFCTRLDPKKGAWECLWTTFLKGGQITVQGPFYDKKNSTLSVTGGTDAFEGASGQMALKSLNGGKKYDFTFELS